MQEIWKDVKDFDGLYQVNNLGVVRSLDRQVYHPGNKSYHYRQGKILSCRINNCGYISVRLCKGGKVYTRFPHRLMAEAFIPNPQNKGETNHRDGNKLNNTLENLEWVTHSENMIHAYEKDLVKKRTNTNDQKLFYIPKIIRCRRSKNEKNRVQIKRTNL